MEIHMRNKLHPMNLNKKHTFSKPILFIEFPSIADTMLGISEQYLFFYHQTGMVDH
jgi:hypothetical protein